MSSSHPPLAGGHATLTAKDALRGLNQTLQSPSYHWWDSRTQGTLDQTSPDSAHRLAQNDLARSLGQGWGKRIR